VRPGDEQLRGPDSSDTTLGEQLRRRLFRPAEDLFVEEFLLRCEQRDPRSEQP
jgi:hypothetical protein